MSGSWPTYFAGATEEESEAAAYERDEAWVVFDGDADCATSCGGWDGDSRRCECEHRRVSWTTRREPDGTWVTFGEAY
jgi:hypothetical protein